MFEKKMIAEFHLDNNDIIDTYIYIMNNQIQGGYIEVVSSLGYTTLVQTADSIHELLYWMGAIHNAAQEEITNSLLINDIAESGLSLSELEHYADRLAQTHCS